MINIKLLLLMTSASLVLSNCAGRVVQMENAQGAQVTCEVSTGSAMMTGILIRDSTIDDCIKDKEASGFKVVNEK